MTQFHFRALAYLLPQVWRALLTPPRTVRYPFEPVELPVGYRGRVRMNTENCRGCGLCARDCPAQALEFQKTGRNHFTLLHYPDRCAYCGQCEISCVHHAIFLDNEFVHGTPQRETLKVILVKREE